VELLMINRFLESYCEQTPSTRNPQ